MPNGVRALSLVPKILPELTSDTAPDASAISVPAETELKQIGEATRLAAGWFGQGLSEYLEAGQMTLETRRQVGSAIAELFLIRQQSTLSQLDWRVVVHREYRRGLEATDPAALRQHEQKIGEYLDHLITIVERVGVLESALGEMAPAARN
jgi:hypothetical protein